MTGGADDWPTVSVILPVRNEAGTVAGALASVLAQEYPRPFEVVIAEGNSSDHTRAIVGELAAREPRLRVVDNPGGTTPAGLNAAIRASKGEVIVRCDGHSELPPGYIRRAVEVMRETGAVNVGGVQDARGRSTMQRAIALAMSIPMGVGDARFHLGGRPGPVDTVFLGVFRRDALERAGLFDERLLRNQDSELNHRLRAGGGIVYFHPDLRVAYYPRATLGGVWRQYWSSGAWKRTTFRIDPRALRPRQAAPPALVLGLLASIGLALSPWPTTAAILPAAYAAGLGASAAWELVRRREAAALLLLFVLPVMHLGWGGGFLFGRARDPHAAHGTARRPAI